MSILILSTVCHLQNNNNCHMSTVCNLQDNDNCHLSTVCHLQDNDNCHLSAGGESERWRASQLTNFSVVRLEVAGLG